MKTSEALKRISAANGALAAAIDALVTFKPTQAYVDAFAEAAALLQGISIDTLSAHEREALAQQTKLLLERTTQAERLFESAGAIRFGSFLSNTRDSGGGYTADGGLEYASGGAFHIDG